MLFLLCALALAACSRPSPVIQSAAAPPAQPAAVATTPAPKTASFKFASQTLTVPEGFTVELVAAPPMVNRPISIAFDEQGRLYATDSSGLSDKSDKQFEQKPHRIVRLVDAEGDGKFEKSTVFAENMMFPQGALFYEGSLYVAAPPHLWKLTDTNGDGVSDQREVWYDGKTLTGCANDLHGPYLGPEGWFYWTKGAFAEQRHTLGNGREFVTRTSHIFRSRPDGTGLEPMLTGGMDNPVGLAFTAAGERVLSGTFFQIGTAGKRDGLIHSVYGGVYGKENYTLAGHARTGDLMPIMTHMGAAAPCGSTAYRSRAFGADYLDNLFVCYFNLRKISRHEMVPDGATFTTKNTDFVTSDSQDFHPTDVLEDADGSLLIVDTGGWYKICCPTAQLAKPDVLGGIYRIRKTGAPSIPDARGLKLPWTTMAPAELARLLADDRPEVQQRATHTLGQRGPAAVPAVSELALHATAAATRQNAVWALARIDTSESRAAVRAALDDQSAAVVSTAMQVLSMWRDAGALGRLVPFLTAENAAHARQAAEALGRMGDARAVEPLLSALRRFGETEVTSTGSPVRAGERTLEHSFIYALMELGRPEPVLAQLRTARSARVVRATLVALDQMAGGNLTAADVIRSLDSNVPVVRQTAGWVASHHAEWGGELADFFRTQLQGPPRSEAEWADRQAQLASLAPAAAIQEVLATTAAEAKARIEVRLLALRAMAAAGLKEPPAVWLSALAAVLTSGDSALTRQAVATARGLSIPKLGHAELVAALVRVGRTTGVAAEVRLEALATATPAALAPVDPVLFDFLCAHLDGREPMLVRSAAATVLARAPLTPAQQLALADTMKTVGALEAPKLLPAFEKAPNEALGLKLIAALQASAGLAGVRATVLKPLFAKYPLAVQQQGDSLLTLLNADAARQNAHVDELLATAPGGDIRRGQAVFNSEKNACTLCHVLGYRGGRLGPDLTNIGKTRSERELLEAIVFPSATLVRGFEPFVVTTKSGDAHSGILRKDTADEVVLATGPETEQHIARAEITGIQPGTMSPMPPGMEAVLTRQELADLVVFLKSRQ
ncbi:MAG: dehydrogenase [Opitutus sp.]|nr:dehydrogenase [Opitutus sp.]